MTTVEEFGKPRVVACVNQHLAEMEKPCEHGFVPRLVRRDDHNYDSMRHEDLDAPRFSEYVLASCALCVRESLQ